MTHDSDPRSAGRARWLAEVAAALDEAQALLADLIEDRVGQADAELLRMRVDELRAEIRAMHQRGFGSGHPLDDSDD